MTTCYYKLHLPIHEEVIRYCELHGYPLSLKKRYIISVIIETDSPTDIDGLVYKLGYYCSNVSKSSIYLVLQWLCNHGLIVKTLAGDQHTILYATDLSNVAQITGNVDSMIWVNGSFKTSHNTIFNY